MTTYGATSKPSIKFAEIRTLEGKQEKGFEELCVQLLPLLAEEKLNRIDRIEGRGGDGGVEAIATTASGIRVGLQSKFFANLGPAQWRQMEDSVRTAIANHPELKRYIVCVPLDRTPGQLKKWNELNDRWKASTPTLSIEWCGCSELIGHLAKPASNYLLVYWFSHPEFSFDWVVRQTELAIDHLHDRYTPLLHQATSAERRLGFLVASREASRDHQQVCSRLVIAWRHVMEKLPLELRKLKVAASLTELQRMVERMQATLHGGLLAKQDGNLVATLSELLESTTDLLQVLFPEGTDATENQQIFRNFYSDTELRNAVDLTKEVSRDLKRFFEAQSQPCWLLLGKAGSGKSHLLASVARAMLSEGRACLLMVGERFAATDALGSQMPKLLGWDGPLRELCSCLSAQATTTGKTSVLMIDAINESPQRGLWRRELPQLATLIQEFPNVKLLISCRSDCVQSSIPSHLLNEVSKITHDGFDLKFHDAVKAYFAGYRVISPQFPTLNSEFKNPLFLKTLCEAYRDRTLPAGPVSFVAVLKEWESRIAEQIEYQFDCPRKATERAVGEIVDTLAKSDSTRIVADEVEAICKKHFPSVTASGSLYRHLNSCGLLQEIETSEGIHTRLQYERFSDVRIAQSVLSGLSLKQSWLAYWEERFLPSIVKSGRLDWAARPRLFAYALLLPGAVGVELVECPISTEIKEDWAQSQAKEELWAAWLDALSWRLLRPCEAEVVRLFSQWANAARSPREVWERLFQFACIPDHPLNADFLHGYLIELVLSQRDSTWTIGLALENPTDQTGESIVAPFLYWADASVGKASEEQSRLASVVLLWLTSSSNSLLRNKASDIAIRILVATRSAKVCMWLLEAFWDVDDPYVKERLLAIVSGVVPYLEPPACKEIAEFVVSRFWQQKEIAPHILQREYAAFIVRHASEIGVLERACLADLQRTDRSSKPSLWSEEQVQRYEDKIGYDAIKGSLRPEEMGNYGDFGRYVMGSKVHHFVDDDRLEPKAKGLGRGGREHDARLAR